MRQAITILLLLGLSKGYAQKVTIQGTAFDTTHGRNRVHIVLNDTLRKFRESKTPNWDIYQKLIKDTTLTLFAKADGKFQITANKTDSLYFQSFKHKQKVYSVSDLARMKQVDIRLDPEVCIPYVRCTDSLPSRFYIFIGQKLKVDFEEAPYYCNVTPLDSRFKAEYKIVQQQAGSYPKDTIRFTAFDHYGRPPFSKYEYVLLFVGEYCGGLYHEKYQYFDLYKTADGKWASPGDPYKYDAHHKKGLRAQNIQFADSVWFDVTKQPEASIKRDFPEPYYKIEGGKATPIMGTYIDDLITVKKEGVLKAKHIIL